ncbi:hypothetical protein ACFV1L_29105 [Kitasatospora sp. NPDC059646]|uniref:hypothetical protein n=1 Tax=Kitasatospora sp. NPDC059646 TaxID=3346893 RepID=UPI003692BADC
MWQGVLTFRGADPEAEPPTLPVRDYRLRLCASCAPTAITGPQVAAWDGPAPPTPDQCRAALALHGAPGGSVPVQVGRTGCFADFRGPAGTVGYFSVVSTSPPTVGAVVFSG